MSQAMKWRQILPLTLPNFGQDIMRGPAIQLIQFIYGTYHGVPLEWLATIVFWTGIFDAVSDPLMGLISDRYYQRKHTRKPFLVIGMIISVIGMWMLFNPTDPENIHFWGFLAIYLCWYAGWTILEVPYLAWKAEATNDYQSRTRIAAVDSIMGLFAGLTLVVVAATFTNNEYVPRTLEIMSWIVVAVLPAAVIIAVCFVPNPPVVGITQRPTLKATGQAVFTSKPFLMFILLFIICSFPPALTGAVGLYYIIMYLGLAELPNVLAGYTVIANLAFIPLIVLLIGKIDKHRAWALGMVAVAVPPAIVVLIAEPNSPWFQAGEVGFYVLVGVSILGAIGVSAVVLSARSMLGDIIDHGKLTYGSDNGGIYASTLTLAAKLSMATANSLALFAIAWFGFNPAEPVFTDEVVAGIELIYAWIPLGLSVATIPFVLAYPITRHRHTEIVEALELQAVAEALDQQTTTESAELS